MYGNCCILYSWNFSARRSGLPKVRRPNRPTVSGGSASRLPPRLPGGSAPRLPPTVAVQSRRSPAARATAKPGNLVLTGMSDSLALKEPLPKEVLDDLVVAARRAAGGTRVCFLVNGDLNAQLNFRYWEPCITVARGVCSSFCACTTRARAQILPRLLNRSCPTRWSQTSLFAQARSCSRTIKTGLESFRITIDL